MEFLVSQGHSLEDVLKLSLRQFQALTQIAWDRVVDQNSVTAISMRAAYHNSPEDFKKFMEEFNGEG